MGRHYYLPQSRISSMRFIRNVGPYTRCPCASLRGGFIQAYTFKRGFKKDAPQRVAQALEECFDTAITVHDNEYTLSYGALSTLTVIVGEQLLIDTESRSDVPDDVMVDTNRRFREFLERATGYTAKQRAKKAQDAIKRSG